MEDQSSITDSIRAVLLVYPASADPSAPVITTKEEMVKAIQEKYPSFTRFDIENTFEQLKMTEHLQEQEEGTYMFTPAFISGK